MPAKQARADKNSIYGGPGVPVPARRARADKNSVYGGPGEQLAAAASSPAKSARADKNSTYGGPGVLRVFEEDPPELMPSLTESQDRYPQGAASGGYRAPPPLARIRSSMLDAEQMQAVAETKASFSARLEQLQHAVAKATAAADAPPPADASVAVRMSTSALARRASEQCVARLAQLEAEIHTAVAGTVRKYAEKRDLLINEERAREQRLLDATGSSGHVNHVNSVWG